MNRSAQTAFIVILVLAVAVIFFGAPSFGFGQGLSPAEEKRLRAELEQYEKEIAEWEKTLAEARGRVNTLDGDVQYLTAKIKEAEATIKAKNLLLTKLGRDIGLKTEKIKELDGRIERGKESLAELVRKTNEIDSFSLVETMLSNQDLSDFFVDVDAFNSVQRDLKALFVEIRDIKGEAEEERAALGQKKNQTADEKYVVEGKKQTIAKSEAEKKQLLTMTKQEASAYQQILADRQQKAASIRNRLFPLRDAGPIKFEDALAFAVSVSSKTGVRPAFILGILKQETNLGANVGQCYLTDPATGAGVGKNTGTPFAKVMKPDRDVQPFLDITKRLGREPYATVVSCPQSVGFGGAMGPSQFIPSTWVMYEGRVASTVGAKTADPWNAEHAFTATALFLKDLGAARGGYSAEREAAARYYAGGGWATRGLGYAANVLALAEGFQADIDFLKEI